MKNIYNIFIWMRNKFIPFILMDDFSLNINLVWKFVHFTKKTMRDAFEMPNPTSRKNILNITELKFF